MTRDASATAPKRNRRPKGTGSLRRLDGNRWQITVKQDGRRHSRVFTARNGTEAERSAAAVRVALMEDVQTQRTSGNAEREQRRTWTVEQYVGYYQVKWAPVHLAATTRQRYESLAKHQVVPHIGDRKMAEVTPSDLMRLYARLGEPGANLRHKNQGLSPHTIWHVRTFLEALYTFAIEVEGDFDTNPARKAKPSVARTAKKTPPAVDVQEVERFVSMARQEPTTHPLVMIPARFGTRRGETLGLRWSDVDYDGQTLTVRRSVCQTVAEGVQVKSTKTKKVRTIPIDADTLTHLRTLMTAQREQRLLHGRGWRGAASPADDHICALPDGSLMPPDGYASTFRGFASANSFGHITPHVLRHAWVSQLIALGYDAVTIASMSGHSPVVLLETYAHAFDARRREAMEALAEARRGVLVAQ